MKDPVFEILTWKSAVNTNEDAMIDAMDLFCQEVMMLPGFLHQALYKRDNGEWVCIYYWQTEKHAHDSNAAVIEWPSFQNLMVLINPETVTMDVFPCLQHVGEMSFCKKA